MAEGLPAPAPTRWTLNSDTVYCTLYEDSLRGGVQDFGRVRFRRVKSTLGEQKIVVVPLSDLDNNIWSIPMGHYGYVGNGFTSYRGRFNTEGDISMDLFTCEVSRDENGIQQFEIDEKVSTSIKTVHLRFYIAGGMVEPDVRNRLMLSRDTFHGLVQFFGFPGI